MLNSADPDETARYEPSHLDIHCLHRYSLRKHAYSNVLKILQPKKENFQINILIFFIFLLGEAVLMSTHNLCF